MRALELECHSEETLKEAEHKAMQDLVRRLSTALGTEYSESMLSSPDGLIHKTSELVEVSKEIGTKSFSDSQYNSVQMSL